MRPRIMSVTRFWNIHIRQINDSAYREWLRSDEGSQRCVLIKVDI